EPLYVLATADEESTMSGARALTDSGKKLGRYALIGEPTGLRPVHMHKGILVESIKLLGRAAHASNPSLGNSAIEGMYAVINALTAWRGELQRAYNNECFHVPVPTLNFGSIHGGDSPNRICAECVMNIELRLLPGMALTEFRSGLHDVVRRAVAGSGLAVEMQANFDGVPAMHTDLDAEIVQYAEKLSGHGAGAVNFVTEGPCLNAMGMQTVVLGPGDIDQAHQANEYLALDRIRPMLGIISGMIGHFCIGEKT
ncbi:MAG: M20/M25/M40 family metallo-hydrolase, partial [Gammaproteobacteria bacterium]